MRPIRDYSIQLRINTMEELEIVYSVTSYGQIVFAEKRPASSPILFEGRLHGQDIYDIQLLLFRGNELVSYRLFSYSVSEIQFILNTVPLQMIDEALKAA